MTVTGALARRLSFSLTPLSSTPRREKPAPGTRMGAPFLYMGNLSLGPTFIHCLNLVSTVCCRLATMFEFKERRTEAWRASSVDCFCAFSASAVYLSLASA